ncbi:MAG TPA: TetR family transcriptional regulator [Gaiellaceae bacterium]|nr:TetR family transcriptional regulator [Gaiellaceae bacterium]
MARTRLINEDRIVEAALALIEERGIDALTVRELGRRLGVEGMALYTYFRSKSDLLDAAAERILEELDSDFDRSLPWQERVRRGTAAWAELQRRHPRAFPLVYRRGARTDAVSLLTEELLDALRSAGFDERAAALAYQSLIVLVDAALLGRSSWTDAELHAAWRRGAKEADPERFPRFREIAPHAATLSWNEILDSGLDLVLGGLQQRLEV